MSKGVVLLEVIISLVLFSFLAIGTVKLMFSFSKTTQYNTNTLSTLLKLESTQLFIQNNQNTHKLSVNNEILYYESNLLLDKVSQFSISKTGTLVTIDICIDQDSICQKWKIRDEL
jgi:type II secretory pathway component PulJ